MSAWQIAKGLLLKDVTDFAMAILILALIGMCAWAAAKRKKEGKSK